MQWTGVDFTQTYAFAKTYQLRYLISYDFEIFKVMSHNLEILSFQKMYGLLGLIREMKALQRSARHGSEGCG